MNQKTLVIAVVAVIIVVAVVAGVYLATRGGGGGPTPTATPSATPSGTGVEGASSLQYTVDITGGETAGTYKFMAKNIGESNMMIRIEISSGGAELTYVVNGAQQKAWSYVGGQWTETSNFSDDWDAWSTTMNDYKESLADWSGTGEYTYTAGETTVRVYGITVNPTLADSLFEPS